MSKRIFLIMFIVLMMLFTVFMVMLVINLNRTDDISTEIELGIDGEKGILANNNMLDFYFYYPENFTLDKNSVMISVFIYDQDIMESNVQDSGTEENIVYVSAPNLNATKFALPEDRYETIEQYWDSAVKQYEIIYSNIEIEPPEDITVDSVPAKKYTYTADIAGMTYKHSQVILFRNRQVYTLTYTATPEKFDKHIKVLDTAVETFKFK